MYWPGMTLPAGLCSGAGICSDAGVVVGSKASTTLAHARRTTNDIPANTRTFFTPFPLLSVMEIFALSARVILPVDQSTKQGYSKSPKFVRFAEYNTQPLAFRTWASTGALELHFVGVGNSNERLGFPIT